MNIINKELSSDLLEIAFQAGKEVLDIYHSKEYASQLKKDLSPVTAADMASHEIIFNSLSKLSPSYPIVSEEDISSRADAIKSHRHWLIDPLDGTKEFISGSDEFTINIALIESGKPILGVVYAPALNLIYWGGIGLGAWQSCNGQTNQIAVDTASRTTLRVVASKSHLNEETISFIAKLGEVDLIQAGSSLKICRVADGSADIYPRLGPTSEWDTAAAHAVLEAAGGVMLDVQRNTLTYGKIDPINPYFIASSSVQLY